MHLCSSLVLQSLPLPKDLTPLPLWKYFPLEKFIFIYKIITREFVWEYSRSFPLFYIDLFKSVTINDTQEVNVIARILGNFVYFRRNEFKDITQVGSFFIHFTVCKVTLPSRKWIFEWFPYFPKQITKSQLTLFKCSLRSQIWTLHVTQNALPWLPICRSWVEFSE